MFGMPLTPPIHKAKVNQVNCSSKAMVEAANMKRSSPFRLPAEAWRMQDYMTKKC